MFPLSEATTLIVKATHGDDVRRLRLQFSSGTTASAAFAMIQQAVQDGFRSSEEAGGCFVLKYADDEGDLCMLSAASMEDLATLAKGLTWRLQASADALCAPAQNVPGTVTNEDQEKTTLPAAPAATPEATDNLPEGCGDDGDDEAPRWLTADMAFSMLSFISGVAHAPFARAAFNRLGVEHRSRVERFCREVAEQLDLVPEAAHLRPKFEAYISGSDIDHFGDLLAELLSAWAGSKSPEMVKDTIIMHHKVFVGVVKQAFKAAKGRGKGKCGFKGHRSHGKGHWGKGFGGGAFGRNCAGWGDAGEAWGADWGIPAGLGAGTAPWMGMFAGLMAQKGMGKGVSPDATVSAACAGTTTENSFSGMEAQEPAEGGNSGGDVSATVAATHALTGEAALSREEVDLRHAVEALMQMGLVNDTEVAKELLMMYNCSVAEVAAAIAG